MSGMKDLFGDRLYEARKPESDIGRALKQEAFDQVKVSAGDWFGKALMIIASLERGWTGIAEEWRFLIEERIGPPPKGRKVYGALTSDALRHHLVERTGRRVSMKDPNSHARLTDEYRRR